MKQKSLKILDIYFQHAWLLWLHDCFTRPNHNSVTDGQTYVPSGSASGLQIQFAFVCRPEINSVDIFLIITPTNWSHQYWYIFFWDVRTNLTLTLKLVYLYTPQCRQCHVRYSLNIVSTSFTSNYLVNIINIIAVLDKIALTSFGQYLLYVFLLTSFSILTSQHCWFWNKGNIFQSYDILHNSLLYEIGSNDHVCMKCSSLNLFYFGMIFNCMSYNHF